ncbi:hypothetical protein FB45DRAFT_1064580 [Roridomyces roridus]|uniref:F-box domain-containing protein n=1 Tax=Roridomyces roridus TaxID=1738132 RepID=A0AAD7BAT5_9AGAR|nr:hypothetical protein FB45DRAFT_1064580 [Roridomyces roridus]
MNFPDLPPEILCRILLLADAKTIIRCSVVSHTWHETIASCSELQYEIQLCKAGLVSGLPSSMSTADKLQALAKHLRAWEKLDWTSTVVDLPAALDPAMQHKLAAGVFALQEDGTEFVHTLTLQENPPATTHSLGLNPRTFVSLAMDPTQDLLVCAYPTLGPDSESITVAFRSLSANRPHPMARCPSITVETGNDYEPRAIHIADDVVGMLFGDPDVIRVWDWRTGILLVDTQLDMDLPDFQFISPRVFVVASSTDSGWLDIFMISPTNTTVHVARLRLPVGMRPDGEAAWMPGGVDIQSGPVCGHPVRGSFFPGSENRIYLCAYKLALAHGDVRNIRLIVHQRALVRYVSQYVREGRTEYIDSEWDDWGPRGARMLLARQTGLHWVFPVHGERVVFLGDQERQLQVLDFGLIHGDQGNDVGDNDTLVLGPTTIDGLFKESVTTYLPFRRTLLRTDEDFDTLLMDQKHIILGNDDLDLEKQDKFGAVSLWKFPDPGVENDCDASKGIQ